MQTERQKEIIEAALVLINDKGIQGFTIKNLANKIGITEPAIYRHFTNKIQILISILEYFKTSTKDILKKELNNNDTSIEKIGHLFTNHFIRFSTTPSLVSVIFSEEVFRSEPILIEKITEVIERNDNILIKIICDGQANGEIRNDIEAKYLSIVIMGSLRLFVKKWQFAGNSFNLRAEGEKLIESIKLIIEK